MRGISITSSKLGDLERSKRQTELGDGAEQEKVQIGEQPAHAASHTTAAYKRILELLENSILDYWVHYKDKSGTKTPEERDGPSSV